MLFCADANEGVSFQRRIQVQSVAAVARLKLHSFARLELNSLIVSTPSVPTDDCFSQLRVEGSQPHCYGATEASPDKPSGAQS